MGLVVLFLPHVEGGCVCDFRKLEKEQYWSLIRFLFLEGKTVDLHGERAPKKVKTVLSARKVMATVFWGSQGVIYIDYLEKGKSHNSQIIWPIRR